MADFGGGGDGQDQNMEGGGSQGASGADSAGGGGTGSQGGGADYSGGGLGMSGTPGSDYAGGAAGVGAALNSAGYQGAGGYGGPGGYDPNPGAGGAQGSGGSNSSVPGVNGNPLLQALGLPQPGQGAGAGVGTQGPGSPYAQLVNMILQSQLMNQLQQYFYPTQPYQGSFQPGVQNPPAAGFGPGGAATPGLPAPTAYLPGAAGPTGNASPAPAGGWTPGYNTSPVQGGFMPPSQSPLPSPLSAMQGPAGTNQGFQQFLSGLGIQGLPAPGGMAGGGTMLMGM